jgi:hypothetical protein
LKTLLHRHPDDLGSSLTGECRAASVLHGLLLGLFAFAGFFLALALLIETGGIAFSFLAAILVALGIQGLSFLRLKRSD